MGRQVVFVPDGVRVRASAADIVKAWRQHTHIDPQYALGTAQHETDFTVNEVDTEVSGFVSSGLYQISKEEMQQAGMPEADPLDLDQCTAVFAAVTEYRFQRILSAVTKKGQIQRNGVDLRAYLSIAHNQGLAACLKTIANYGMDWNAYKDRNRKEAQAAIDNAVSLQDKDAALNKMKWWESAFAYGDDCISGGSAWREGL